MTGRDRRQESPRIPIVDKRAGSGPDGPPPDEDAVGEAAVEEARDPLAEATQLAEDRLDQLKRLKADFENYRQRVIREQTELVDRAGLRIVERLLPVVDDLERALAAARMHEGAEAIVRGVELVWSHLHDVLMAEGLERIDEQGDFDPHEHEAVSSVPGDVGEPTILEVVRPGYRLKGKTVRPALVHVSVPATDAEGEEG